MPSLEKITIDPRTLNEILLEVSARKHDLPIIIIDTYNSFTVRDTDQQTIVEVPKSEREKPLL